MGARAIGHVDYLARMAPPHVGVVLNVGTAHVGEFGSREAIATAKSGSWRRCRPTGSRCSTPTTPPCAPWPRSPPRASCSSARPTTPTSAPPTSPSTPGPGLVHRAHPAGSRAVHLGLVGRHHVGNALAVVAVAAELGRALETRGPHSRPPRPASRWRMEVTDRADGVTLVNDAYNANPDSMRAALGPGADGGGAPHLGGARHHARARRRVRRAARRGRRRGRRPGHRRAGRRGGRRRATGGRGTCGGHGIRGGWPSRREVPDADSAAALLEAELAGGDVVLFKSSRDAGLRLLGDRLAGPREELT